MLPSRIVYGKSNIVATENVFDLDRSRDIIVGEETSMRPEPIIIYSYYDLRLHDG